MPAIYATLYATVLKSPTNHGAMKAYYSGATSIKKLAIWYKLDKNITLFGLHIIADKAIKFQIPTSVDSIYTQALKAKYIVYGNLSCLEVITHLNRN